MSAQAEPSPDPSAGGTLRLASVKLADPLPRIGRYEILSELGQGAMARVYLARDPNIGRKVALKVLEPRGLLTELEMEELRTRFLLEARAAGNLRHPAAVAIYDADHDSDSGHSYIAMEWVDGQSLDTLLKAGKRLPLEHAIAIVCQVAGALDAAHQQGLIHRDVKPGNILLDAQGNAKLSDFGIAKIESFEITSTGQVLGTPFYMSPEQILDEPLDGRSDLFSLAVVFYQCVTGNLPFHSDSLPALTHKILKVDPRIPRLVNPNLPESVSTALMRALEKDAALRFQSGAELARALGREVVSVVPAISETLQASQLAPAARDTNATGRFRLAGPIFVSILLVGLALGLSPRLRKLEKPAIPPTTPHTSNSTGVEIPTGPAAREMTGASSDVLMSKIPEPPSPEGEAAFADATLMISYTNRLKEATMDVWVDGIHVHQERLIRPPGLLKRATGRKDLTRIPVKPGHHDVKVRIEGKEGKIEASNWSGNNFEKGQSQLLRLELIPPKYLKMSWK